MIEAKILVRVIERQILRHRAEGNILAVIDKETLKGRIKRGMIPPSTIKSLLEEMTAE